MVVKGRLSVVGCMIAFLWAHALATTLGCSGGGSSDNRDQNTPSTSNTFGVEYADITYRIFESGTNRYQLSMGISENGEPCDEDDIISILLRNPLGIVLNSTNSGFYEDRYILLNCRSGNCTKVGLFDESGIWAHYDELMTGDYSADIEMENGRSLIELLTFPGQLVLPYISSNTMTADFNGEDLKLSWSNPTDDPNWSEVDEIRIAIYDDFDNFVLYIQASPDQVSITVPASAIDQAEMLNGGTKIDHWRIQTRAYDIDGISYAKAFSNKAPLTSPMYAISFFDIDYRVYESGSNRYQASLGITRDEGPVSEPVDIKTELFNSSGMDFIATNNGFWEDTYFWYDCAAGTCKQAGPFFETGLWGVFDIFPVDTYTIQLELENGQNLTAVNGYNGMLELPFVNSASMSAQFSGDELRLSWDNPTTEPNWNEVDQLRIVIFDNLGNSVLYVRPAVTDTSITIPTSLLDEAKRLVGGSSLDLWQIQTRANVTGGGSFARAYSIKAPLP